MDLAGPFALDEAFQELARDGGATHPDHHQAPWPPGRDAPEYRLRDRNARAHLCTEALDPAAHAGRIEARASRGRIERMARGPDGTLSPHAGHWAKKLGKRRAMYSTTTARTSEGVESVRQ